jgi:hypothetical protein
MAHYIAKPFVAGTAQAEVTGHTLQAYSSSVDADVILPLLPKHGLNRVHPEKWYPQQSWMNILRDMYAVPGGKTALVAIGKQIARTAALPPDVDSIPKALQGLNTIHHHHLRNAPSEEGYTIQQEAERHYRVYHNTPNPLDTIYGLLCGLVERFRQPGESFCIQQIENPHPDDIPGVVFEVRWG